MKYFSSDIIFPGHLSPVENGILVVDDTGVIFELLDPSLMEIPDSIEVEYFPGILCPGFVNSHCHLELSHMKGMLQQKQTLTAFVEEFISKRGLRPDEVQPAAIAADAEMYANGIVAVGDISNAKDSIAVKKQSKMYYHTFVELFDIDPDRAVLVFENGKKLMNEFASAGLRASIVPHAPYTVTEKLFDLIASYSAENENLLCIHNQETESEDTMFRNGSGRLYGTIKKFSRSLDGWKPPGVSSLSYILNKFKSPGNFQLVHNTFTQPNDLSKAVQRRGNLYWCICPKANLFIEDRLPDIRMMKDLGCRLTVGTDSYASNFTLSILDELKIIAKYFPDIRAEEMIRWVTINGAAFLGIEAKYGSFEKGKQPGILHIHSMKDVVKCFDSESIVRRVV